MRLESTSCYVAVFVTFTSISRILFRIFSPVCQSTSTTKSWLDLGDLDNINIRRLTYKKFNRKPLVMYHWAAKNCLKIDRFSDPDLFATFFRFLF